MNKIVLATKRRWNSILVFAKTKRWTVIDQYSASLLSIKLAEHGDN